MSNTNTAPTAPFRPIDFRRGRITVAPNGRHLVQYDGTPFFYLGDTAWELLHRLSRPEIDSYLANRAAKGFTVAQVVVLGEIDGLTTPNAEGELPLIDLDPTQPNPRYFALLDYLVEQAEQVGMCVAVLPTWGAYTVEEKHVLFEDHLLFNPDNAYVYGRFFGQRYAESPNIIWVLGGDRSPAGVEAMWHAMARGITEAVTQVEPRYPPLMTYHPYGGHSSSEWMHDAPWLSFNMLQSGHKLDGKPYEMVASDYARTPIKPVINGEPTYEAIPDQLDASRPKSGADIIRRHAYWSVFAGACGHAYGANEMWMMWRPELEPLTKKLDISPFLGASTPWYQAMDYEGAGQLRHLRALIESRPMLTQIPAQDLIASSDQEGEYHIQAARCAEGSYAMVYIPQPDQTVAIHLDHFAGGPIRAWWYDPRTGAAHVLAEGLPAQGTHEFTTPSTGPDWVLVLDDDRKGFPPPGSL